MGIYLCRLGIYSGEIHSHSHCSDLATFYTNGKCLQWDGVTQKGLGLGDPKKRPVGGGEADLENLQGRQASLSRAPAGFAGVCHSPLSEVTGSEGKGGG